MTFDAIFNPGGRLEAPKEVGTPEAEMDEAVQQAEDTARSLKRLELSSRRIGDSGRYDATSRGFLETLSQLRDQVPAESETGLRRIDLARMAEIVCGRDAALRLLGLEPAESG